MNFETNYLGLFKEVEVNMVQPTNVIAAALMAPAVRSNIQVFSPRLPLCFSSWHTLDITNPTISRHHGI